MRIESHYFGAQNLFGLLIAWRSREQENIANSKIISSLTNPKIYVSHSRNRKPRCSAFQSRAGERESAATEMRVFGVSSLSLEFIWSVSRAKQLM